MTKNIMPFSPRSRIGPSGSLSARRFGPAILAMNGNQARFTLVPASIWGMSDYLTTDTQRLIQPRPVLWYYPYFRLFLYTFGQLNYLF